MSICVTNKLLSNKDIVLLIDTYQATRCQDVLKRLILHFHKMIRRLVNNISKNIDRHEDLVQVGTIGLIVAINKYNKDINNGFLSYAIPTIKGEIKHYIRDCTWSVHVPRGVKDLLPRINQAIDALFVRYHRHPTHNEISSYLNIKYKDICRTMEMLRGYNAISLCTDCGPDENKACLLSHTSYEEKGYLKVEQRMLLQRMMEVLSNQERNVIQLIFFRNMSQHQVGQHLGVSQMHISRTRKKALQKMRMSIN